MSESDSYFKLDYGNVIQAITKDNFIIEGPFENRVIKGPQQLLK